MFSKYKGHPKESLSQPLLEEKVWVFIFTSLFLSSDLRYNGIIVYLNIHFEYTNMFKLFWKIHQRRVISSYQWCLDLTLLYEKCCYTQIKLRGYIFFLLKTIGILYRYNVIVFTQWTWCASINVGKCLYNISTWNISVYAFLSV